MVLVRSGTWQGQNLLKASSHGSVSPGRTGQLQAMASSLQDTPAMGSTSLAETCALGRGTGSSGLAARGHTGDMQDVPKAARAGH